MTDPHRKTLSSTAACVTACLLLAACSNSTPAAHTTSATHTKPTGHSAAAVQTTAPTTDTTNVPVTNAATATSPPTGAGGAPSACALITEKDVTSTIGADPGKGSAFSSHGANQCQYGSFQTEVVLVNVLPFLGKLSYDHIVKAANGRFRQIAGLGDGALEHSDIHSDTVYFLKGDAPSPWVRQARRGAPIVSA
jgi:hypothetical protein